MGRIAIRVCINIDVMITAYRFWFTRIDVKQIQNTIQAYSAQI